MAGWLVGYRSEMRPCSRSCVSGLDAGLLAYRLWWYAMYVCSKPSPAVYSTVPTPQLANGDVSSHSIADVRLILVCSSV